MKPYQEDLNYYFFKDGQLVGDKLQNISDEVLENAFKINEAVWFVQKLGCIGKSQHIIHNEEHRTALAILRMAVEKYGEVFPVVLRGCSGSLPLDQHLILFGTTDPDVAAFYGEVREFCNIRGLRTNSFQQSVKTDDLREMDEEIIFFF